MKRTNATGFAPGNLFTDGNPVGGVPATVVEQTWLNNVQEELCEVIEEAGFVLNGADTTQLKQAIAAMIAAGNTANYKTTEILVANRTLTLADIGKYFSIGANGITVTMPNPNTLPLGARFEITNPSFTGCTLTTPAGDVLDILANATFTSRAIAIKSCVEMVCVSTTRFHAVNQTMDCLIAAAGYTKLSNGLILQWGGIATSAGGEVTPSFPMTFPTACLRQFVTADGVTTAGAFITSNTPTTSNMKIGGWANSSTRSATPAGFLVIGH